MMTAKKLKRMLKRTPGSGILSIFLLAAMFGWSIHIMPHLFEKNEPLAHDLLLIAALVLLQLGAIYLIIKYAKGAIKVKKNGKKTIEYLESRGLMEAAAAEYSQPGRAALRAADRDFSMDKFLCRDNTLTENFIFALTSNQIICYQDVERAYLVTYVFTNSENSGFYSNEVFTLLTRDGEEIDLLSYQPDMQKPPREILDWICNVIKLRNPKCEINTKMSTIRKR